MQNSSSQQLQSIQVACHSGRSYDDRPTSFVWNGKRYDIDSIEREWLEPDEKHFIVQAIKAETPYDEKRFDICYYTQEDIWRLNEIQ
jgi:hypothetical protein